MCLYVSKNSSEKVKIANKKKLIKSYKNLYVNFKNIKDGIIFTFSSPFQNHEICKITKMYNDKEMISSIEWFLPELNGIDNNYFHNQLGEGYYHFFENKFDSIDVFRGYISLTDYFNSVIIDVDNYSLTSYITIPVYIKGSDVFAYGKCGNKKSLVAYHYTIKTKDIEKVVKKLLKYHGSYKQFIKKKKK